MFKKALQQEIENNKATMGIDLNPNTIGISVIEKIEDGIKVIHAQEFSLKPIFTKIFNEKLRILLNHEASSNFLRHIFEARKTIIRANKITTYFK